MTIDSPQICALNDAGLLQVAGKDAVKFLQGYTTCNLDDLTATGLALTGASCNIQGRMITSFHILPRQDALLLRMHRPLVATTIDFLSQYIVFSKASLTDMSDALHCYGVLGCEHNPTNTYELDGASVTLNLGDRQELWVPGRQATNAPESAWALADIEAGIAWVQAATSGKFLPQMFHYDQTGGIDFNKGCYLGQEVVARMQYRGELKRRLYRLTSQSSRPVGCALAGGTVVAAAELSQGGSELLAVLRNTGSDGSPITARFDDGEQVPATLVPGGPA